MGYSDSGSDYGDWRRGGNCGRVNDCGYGYGWQWWWCPCLGLSLFFIGLTGALIVASSGATTATPPQTVVPYVPMKTVVDVRPNRFYEFWRDSAPEEDSLPTNWMTSMQTTLDSTDVSSTGLSAMSSGGWNMVWLNPFQRNFITIPRIGSRFFGVGVSRRNGRYIPVHFMPELISLQGSATITKNTGEQWDIYAFSANPSLFRSCRDTVIRFQSQGRVGGGGMGHGGGGGMGHGGGGGMSHGGGHGGGMPGGGGGGHGGGGGMHGGGGGGDWHGGWNHGGHHGNNWWGGGGGWGNWWGSPPVYVTQPVPVGVVVASPGIPNPNPNPGNPDEIQLFVHPTGC
jgi:hypothetical protein